MPYSKQTEIDLMQKFKEGSLKISLTRLEESSHGFNKVVVYTVRFYDRRELIFRSNDSNIDRAWNWFDRLHKAIILGRYNFIEGSV